MRLLRSLTLISLALAYSGSVFAGVTKEETAQLGKKLTPMGAEKAGNKEGTIPAYDTSIFGNHEKKGILSKKDPFANERPLFSINAKNMAQYADKLTEGEKALMKKYPTTFRMDVYRTHRTTGIPKWINDATIKNVGKAVLVDDGNGIRNAQAFIPFPIPKNGHEAMWNQHTAYMPTCLNNMVSAYTVDSNGRPVQSAVAEVIQEYPYWDIKKKDVTYFAEVTQKFIGPARRAGEGVMVFSSINPMEYKVKAYLYLPGQRRVKLAPEVGFDSPEPASSGATTYDDNLLYSGSLERYNFKLIGKKEMYVPYNNYKMQYHSTPAVLFQKGHMNPDYLRYELHRVWVVEATLKPTSRHVYHRRVFYIDEDSWWADASDEYDARGQLYRAGFAYMTPSLEYPAPQAQPIAHFDLITGQYTINGYAGEKGYMEFTDKMPPSHWTPGSLSGSGVR
ncbi:MAG: DUF1329 domain-containing protein [Desulfuromonadaceae bacterium]|nr:DUF1329 domain-containing protein [Desulfuromonadaceae bacterium]